MKSIIDRRKLKRKATLSHIASLGGILLLLGNTAILLWKPEWAPLMGWVLFAGFALSAIGIYYANRWVKRPRPEDTLDQALKGLSDRYRLYHYELSHDHVLLTPDGVVVIETRNIDGHFSYTGGKWHQRMSLSRAFRFFLEEQLGDPVADAQAAADYIRERLEAARPAGEQVPVRAVVTFVHPMAVGGRIENPPVPVCWPDKLRKCVVAKGPRLSPDLYSRIQSLLDHGQL